MITITVTDPHNTPTAELRLIGNLLLSIAADHFVAPVTRTETIALEDLPSTGSPLAVEAFKGSDEQSRLDPLVAFGVPPVVAAGFTTDPVPALPNVPPVGAPFTAGAGLPLTAHAGTPDISANVTTALLPPAQNYDATGATVAHPVPPAPPAPGVELDKHGLPWDSRIHASTKAKNADGSWRNKRGVDAADLARVEAELRAVMAAPGAPVPAAVAAIPAPPLVSAPPAVAPNVPPAPPSAPAPTIPTAPAPAAATGSIAYPELAQRITAGLVGKTLTPEQVTAACAGFGIPAFPLLCTRPDLVPAVAAALGFA